MATEIKQNSNVDPSTVLSKLESIVEEFKQEKERFTQLVDEIIVYCDSFKCLRTQKNP